LQRVKKSEKNKSEVVENLQEEEEEEEEVEKRQFGTETVK
jgi:hypothetical protein